jgi:DNA-directed RNA polymerase specialized sigma24 family protein
LALRDRGQPRPHAAPAALAARRARGPDAPADETLERNERASLVRAALGTLGERDREVLVLHYFDGLECREIAAERGPLSGRGARAAATVRGLRSGTSSHRYDTRRLPA